MATVSKRTWVYQGKKGEKDEQRTAWVIRYADQAGKRRLKTCQTKKDADAWRTKIETEIQGGTHTPDAASVTVEEAVKLWLNEAARRVRDHDGMTRTTYQLTACMAGKHLLPHLGGVKLSHLTAPRVQAWVTALVDAGAGPSVIEKALQILRSTIGHAQLQGLVARNVVVDAKPRVPKKPSRKLPIPSKAEIRDMISKARLPEDLIFVCAILTGLRQGELLALTWDNVDLKENKIRVRHSADAFGTIKEPKSFAGLRDVPISPRLKTMLMEWKLAAPRQRSNLVFPNTVNARPILRSNLHQTKWRPFMVRLGLADETGKPKYHFHALRHAAASLFIEQNLQPKQVQVLMGHSDFGLTMNVYGHLFEDDDKETAAAAGIDAELFN